MSDPITLDLAGIRARAEAADAGPWTYEETERGIPWVVGPSSNPSIPSPDVVASTCSGGVATKRSSDRLMPNDRANLKHVATMDPPTTLALVDEVERLTRERDQAISEGAAWHKAAWTVSDNAKAKIADLREQAEAWGHRTLSGIWKVSQDKAVMEAYAAIDGEVPVRLVLADAAEAEVAKLQVRVAELERRTIGLMPIGGAS